MERSDRNPDSNTDRNPDWDAERDTVETEQKAPVFSPFVLRTMGGPKIWARYE